MPEACEQRWIVMRNKYTKIKREIRASPSGSAASQCTWPYFEMMGFLDPFLTTRRTTSNYQIFPKQEISAQSPPSSPFIAWDTNSQVTSDSTFESNSRVQTPLSATLDNHETPSTSNSRTMPKKRNAQEAMIDKMSTCFDNFNKRVQSSPTPDEDLHFARSLAQDMKILTPLQKIQLKRTIYELLENFANKNL
ncbi:unnamed protein product [Brassicogethes aeneus]|uniref:BESS domain-containing protein n=1 Tax=Brassicogethes aeneus TaxID=1431903 RepID=A0A9P0FC51_BRAAE|nr:unnamed protein product [Brassicogethes aeneus]